MWYKKINIALRISLIYLGIISIYLILSDQIILQIAGSNTSAEMLTKIETYIGLAIILLTTAALFVLIQHEIKVKRKAIHKLELQKQEMFELTSEYEKVKTRLQERNIYIETILKYLPIGLAVNKIDDGNVIFMNENFTEIYGWPEKELTSLDNFFNNVYPDEAYRKIITERVLADINSGDPNKMCWEGIEITTCSGEKKIINAQNIPVNEQNLMISTVQDITAMKKAEEQLKNNEKRFRELVNSLNSGIVIHAPDTTIVYSNPKAIELLGLNNEQLIGKHAHDPSWIFLHENGKPYTIEEFPVNQIINRKSLIENLVIGVSQPVKQEVTWLIANGFPVLDNDNGIKEVIISLVDITGQKNANIKLKESEEHYKLLAENTSDVISMLDTKGQILYMSPSIKNVSGYEPEDLLGKISHIYFHPDDISLVTSESYWNKLKSGHSTTLIYRFKSKDGKYGWFESSRQPIFNNRGELEKIVSIARNITERVEREKLIENYHKSLKKLTIEISLVEEKQRKGIAANIHDYLSQKLVIAKMKLKDLINDNKIDRQKLELETINILIADALDNTRKITYDLCPPVLYEFGLIETMYWLAEKTQQEHQLKTIFSTDIKEIQLTESKLILIFRIIQELVNNTIKHAKANVLKINIVIVEETLEIIVSDDGIGFTPDASSKASVEEGGFGLFTVKERVQNLNGRITINSEIKKGTTIKISVPLDT
jgi:PAS domain S-box-containing protein